MEDCDEGTQVAAALGGIFHVLDAIVRVRMNNLLRKRFERVASGDGLVQNVRAVSVFRNQSLESVNLTANFAKPNDERVLFIFRMNVFHSRQISRTRGNGEDKIAVDAYRGRGYSLPYLLEQRSRAGTDELTEWPALKP